MTNRNLRHLALMSTMLMACSVPSVSLGQTCYTGTIQAATPTTQYVIHGDGTITDTTTSLMWKQCPEGQSSLDCSTGAAALFRWDQALQTATAVNTSGGFAGYSDWRMPSIAELTSIIETQCTSPAINLAVFPNTGNLFFWTNSPDANDDSATWFVEFKFGNTGTAGRDQVYPIRLVRSVE